MGKKTKPLKTIITFSSPAIYAKATAHDNTSALIEALLARHFNLPIEGSTLQAQTRREVLADQGGMKVPVFPLGAVSTPVVVPVTNSPEQPNTVPVTSGVLSGTDEPLALPELPVNPPLPTATHQKIVEPPLPDRPATFTPAPAFAPVATLYAPGSRLCPTCGNDLGTSPHCLNCL